MQQADMNCKNVRDHDGGGGSDDGNDCGGGDDNER